ncbi:MAG: hypothetical protein ACLPSW_13385 [Roseiarcus sp.]
MEKRNNKLTATQVAEKAKPNWRAVTRPAADADAGSSPIRPDATSPELDSLMTKYFGASKPRPRAAARTLESPAKESELVVMEPKVAADVRPGRKVLLVEDGKVVGEQG